MDIYITPRALMGTLSPLYTFLLCYLVFQRHSCLRAFLCLLCFPLSLVFGHVSSTFSTSNRAPLISYLFQKPPLQLSFLSLNALIAFISMEQSYKQTTREIISCSFIKAKGSGVAAFKGYANKLVLNFFSC